MPGRKNWKTAAAAGALTIVAGGALWGWWNTNFTLFPSKGNQMLTPEEGARNLAAGERLRESLGMAKPSVVPARAEKARPAPEPPDKLLARLDASSGTPGVVVGEPVPRGADAEAVTFGAGCARWLSFALSGEGSLGQTPAWSTVSRLMRSLGRQDLRLSPTDGKLLAQRLGVTHAVLGEISGRGGRLKLTYRVYTLPQGAPKDAALTAEGSAADVARKLPELLLALRKRLDAPGSPDAPPADQPADLALIGRATGAHRMTEAARADLIQRLEPISFHSLVAAATLLDVPGWWEVLRSRESAAGLMKRFPNHPFTLFLASEAPYTPEYSSGAETETVLQAVIQHGEALRNQFPYSHLTQLALANAYGKLGRHEDARDAAEAAVLSARRNPDGWRALAEETERLASHPEEQAPTLAAAPGPSGSGPAPTARPGATQWSRSVLLGAQVEPLKRRLMALEPHDAETWLRVAEAAVGRGDLSGAGQAFWKAARLSPDADTLHWGLDLYSERSHQPEEFARVVAYILSKPSADIGQRQMMEGYLFKHNRLDAARRLARTAEERAEIAKWSQKDPVRFVGNKPPDDLAPQRTAGPWLIGKSEGLTRALSWSPDGRRLAVADDSFSAAVWTRGSQPVRQLAGHSAPLCGLGWSSSGNLATAAADHRLTLWNPANGEAVRTIEHLPAEKITGMAWRPNGDRVVLMDEDGFYWMGNPFNRSRMRVPNGERFSNFAEFSPDGALVALSTGGRTLSIRSADDGRELHRIELPSARQGFAWRPDSKAFAVSGSDYSLRVLDLDGRPLAELKNLGAFVQALAWGPEGRVLAYVDEPRVFKLWEPATGKRARAPQGHNGGIVRLAWDQRNNRIASAGTDRAMLLWNPAAIPLKAPAAPPAVTGSRLLTPWKSYPADPEQMPSLAFSADARVFAQRISPYITVFRETESGKEVRRMERRSPDLHDLLFSSDGKTLYGVTSMGVSAWEYDTGNERWRSAVTDIQERRFLSLARLTLSPDGKWLAGASSLDSQVRVWDPAGKVRRLPVDGFPGSTAFSPDGRLLAVGYGGSGDWGKIDLWETGGWKKTATISGNHEMARKLSFSPDGAMLASFTAADGVRLWRVAERRLLRTLEAKRVRATNLTFLPGERLLLTGDNADFWIWSTRDGRVLEKPRAENPHAGLLAVSPDGRAAAVWRPREDKAGAAEIQILKIQ